MLGMVFNFGSISANDNVPFEAPKLIIEEPSPRTGFIPPSMDLPHLDGQKLPEKFQALTVPAQWDWRTSGKVTSVRNQGACGSCYAFAALGTIESKMLIDGAGTYDFSENNAKECNWYGTRQLYKNGKLVFQNRHCDRSLRPLYTCRYELQLILYIYKDPSRLENNKHRNSAGRLENNKHRNSAGRFSA